MTQTKTPSVDSGTSGLILGPLEASVFAKTGEIGPATVADVHGSLSKERAIAYTTVMTVMGRLFDKGLLVRTKDGRRHVYSLATENAEAAEARFRKLFSGLISGFRTPAIRHFVETLSAADEHGLSELEEEIRRARERKVK